MNVLVVGGAGYIGSHMAKQLARAGYKATILDNLSTGFRHLACYGELVIGDINDTNILEQTFSKNDFLAVIHFAALSQVGESVVQPAKYYKNNVAGTINLLDVMLRHKVMNFIFSSTAATFGNPEYSPIDEKHAQKPINPYGMSKLMVEHVLTDYAQAYGLNSVSLRYFNACGADPEGKLGECHDPETHLIPLILQAASGRRSSITVFGRDYPTHDGTCVRDYIHIEDLCSAHGLALSHLLNKKLTGAEFFNLGNGKGFSVQEVIDVVKNVINADGCNLIVEEGSRRAGDPAVLVADASRAREVLGWKPEYTELKGIIEHAWKWEKAQVDSRKR
jgi:UDP-glucose 4-epimerase